jgi:hypothetical protein
MKSGIELRCSRDLALWLGAVHPETAAHHKQLRDSGHYLLVRDKTTGWPMFWPWIKDLIAKPS